MKALKRTLSIQCSVQELKLNPFTLSFVGDNEPIEKRFKSGYFDNYLDLFRLCHLASIVLYGILGILDAVLFAEYTGTLWFIRFGIVVPVFVCGFFFTFHPGYRKLWPLINNGYVILTGSSFIAIDSFDTSAIELWVCSRGNHLPDFRLHFHPVALSDGLRDWMDT